MGRCWPLVPGCVGGSCWPLVPGCVGGSCWPRLVLCQRSRGLSLLVGSADLDHQLSVDVLLCDHAVGGLGSGAGAGAAASARGGGEEYYYRLSKPLNPVTFPEYQSLLIMIMVVYFAEYKL